MQPNPIDFHAVKTLLRARSRARRDSLNADQKRDFSAQIVARAARFAAEIDASTIAIYRSNGREVDLDSLVPMLHSMNRRVVAPREVDGDDEMPFEVLYGTLRLQSTADAAQSTAEHVSPHEIELFFVPALAFDARGNRLGQGGGWYDRVLTRAPRALVVGVAFSIQIVADVPREAHDRSVDWVICEDGISECGR